MKDFTRTELRKMKKAQLAEIAATMGIKAVVHRDHYPMRRKDILAAVLEKWSNEKKTTRRALSSKSMGATRKTTVWTLDELQTTAMSWWNRDWKETRLLDAETLAALLVKAERDEAKAMAYLQTTKTGTDDPAHPEKGRPWSGIIQGWKADLQGEVRMRFGRGRRQEEFTKAYATAANMH